MYVEIAIYRILISLLIFIAITKIISTNKSFYILKIMNSNFNKKHFNLNSPFWKCPNNTINKTQYKSQYNEDKYIINYFKEKKLKLFNRVYVEVGAFDGYDMSNTFALEHGYGWKGLLIEASPFIFKRLIKTERPRSIKINKAICNEDGYVEYNDNNIGLGGIAKYINNKNVRNKYNVSCSPISKIIKENDLRYVDVFSLDVEGAEEEVLKTFDWTIPVRLWIIEVNALVLNGSEIDKQKCRNVQNILKSHGYRYIGVSSQISVNEFYEKPNFDILIKQYIEEDNEVYRRKKCLSI